MNIPIQICILGGGFGGLYTALHLQRFPQLRSRCEITLVEQRDHFLFTPLLYELVTGELQPWEIAPSFTKLLASTNVQFCQGKIQGVDLEARQVRLQDDQLIPYDYLVLAVGAETRLDEVPGAATYAIPFRTLVDVERLKQQLRILELSDRMPIRVAVMGGGPSGVELAGKLADQLGRRGQVRLLERGNQILKTFPAACQKAAYQALKARGVRVELETSIDKISADQITSVRHGYGETLPIDLVLWTAGSRSIEWVRNLACEQNSQGQLLTFSTLQLVEYPEVFALGDLASIQDASGKRVPATAQAAFQQASCAADNLSRLIANKPLRRFRYLYLGEMMTVGKGAAIVYSFGLTLKGSLAYLTRKAVYIQRLPTLRHRLQVVKHWFVTTIHHVMHTVLSCLSAGRRLLGNSQRRRML